MSVAIEAEREPSHTPALAVLTTLFFVWGLLTSLNDILVPHLKAIFTLSYLQAMLIQFCFFGAYFIVSLPAGYLVEKVGYRLSIVFGLCAAGLGCLAFYPAASARSYPLFLAALFVLASGITLLQVAANPCVANLGSEDTAPSRLNLSQAFNSLGTTIGPLLGAALILSDAVPGAASVAHEVRTVQGPYLTLAVLLFVIAAVFSRFHLPAQVDARRSAHEPNVHNAEARGAGRADERAPRDGGIWRQRHLVLGVAAIFLYVGAEVSIGSVLVSFMAQPEVGGLSERTAGSYLSLYWGAAMVGRFIGAGVLRKFDAGRVLAGCALGAVLLLIASMSFSGALAMGAALAVGLCNSIMFPTIFALAVAELGPRTGEGSGLLCMAIVGGAIVPVAMGFVADSVGLTPAFLVPLVCYAYIVHYGLAGHRVR
jgi:FHS family L-fucose permease-like MFS transporter